MKFRHACVLGTFALGLAAHPGSAAPELAYQLTEGQNLNAFVRDGKVAAHMLLRSGRDPRILVAFPAGNSGTGLWFDRLEAAATWRLEVAPRPITLRDARGRGLYGIRAVASIAAPHLRVKGAVLSNVRYLRDYELIAKAPPEIATPARIERDTLDYRRDRIDGGAGYQLSLRVLDGRLGPGGIDAGADGRIRLEITAASGEPALTPLGGGALLNASAASDPAARRALTFLSYREKFLAGSWRFNTYFGRDTLMSVRLLMPVLQPAAIEAGLSAVLARLNEGQVAHEEGIGEFALLTNRAHGRAAQGDKPDLDYKMVDGTYMLAPVAAEYLLHRVDRAAARAFLARPIQHALYPRKKFTAGGLLVSNLRGVVDTAQPFAQRPGIDRLIAIKDGFNAGQWRDSDNGIGGGRYAYDVNAVFVPAALHAAADLFRAGLLDPYLEQGDREALERAATLAGAWRKAAPPLFEVTRSTGDVRAAIQTYAAEVGVPAAPALAALPGGSVRFHAISLNADGSPVPILNSDEGFALLFGDPAPADLEAAVTAMMRPFPAGLMTDIGLLVANPVLASPDWRAKFAPSAYHGAVVWSWQQALFAAGLDRQLKRTDLPAPVRATLAHAQTTLWRAIKATRAISNSELWSWEWKDGAYRVVPFGAGRKDVDESNAAQLWSTVYLAVKPPR